jgi:hypothetical protein
MKVDNDKDSYAFTYRLNHPDIIEPLEIDAHVERSEAALKGVAMMYTLRNFDHPTTLEDWTVEKLEYLNG